MEDTFWIALKGSSGQMGQWIREEMVVMALRSGMMTCGKEKVGTVCRSVRVR
jgi:hypothetical protein